MSNDNLHDVMLRAWVDKLQREGYSIIAAALPGWDRPEPVGDSIPDLSGRNTMKRKVLGEVKVCSDLDNDHTKGQLEDYLSTGSEVLLLVPKSCVAEAHEALAVWGWTGRVKVWRYPGL